MPRKVSVKRFSEVSKLIASWPENEREQIVRDLAYNLPDSRVTEIADGIKRRAYHNEIRSLAEDFKRRVEAGEFETREDMLDDLHATIDGHHDVIYTACAMDVVCVSDSSGAYAEEFGSEGMVEGGDIQWSRLAFAAMYRDLCDQLDAEGVDLNEDPPAKKSER
jgi:hypothetical protein